MSLDIAVIGPGLWNAIHHTAAICDLRDDGKAFFTHWIVTFVRSLPCERCRKHALEHIKGNPPDQEDSYSIWAWKMHNKVNEFLGKKKFPFSIYRQIWLQGAYPTCTDC